MCSSGLDVITNESLDGYTLNVDVALKNHVVWAHIAVIRKDGFVLHVFGASIPDEYVLKAPNKTYGNDAEVIATSLGMEYFEGKVKNCNCNYVRVITDSKTALDVFNDIKYENKNLEYELKINNLIMETKNIMSKAGIKFNVTWESRLSNGLADCLCKLLKVNVRTENGEKRFSIERFDVTVEKPFDANSRRATIDDVEFWKIAKTDQNRLPRVFLPSKKDM